MKLERIVVGMIHGDAIDEGGDDLQSKVACYGEDDLGDVCSGGDGGDGGGFSLGEMKEREKRK